METEKRLIDANAFRKSINGWKLGKIPKGELLWDLDRQPTVDAVEVVHGHWVPFYEEVPIYNAGGFTERRQTGWICSKCGNGFTQFGHQRYCGDCGTKMDGVQE